MPELIGPLFLFALAMTLTPGPNRRVVPHMLGVTIGLALMQAALGLGLAGLFQAEPRIHAVLKYLGAAYLLYLAWRIARAGKSGGQNGRDRPITFFEAALFQWVNPKAWMIALGALTAYTTVGGSMLHELGLIVAVLTVLTFPAMSLWALFGTGLGRWLNRPRARAAFNWSMAALLALSLVPVFW